MGFELDRTRGEGPISVDTHFEAKEAINGFGVAHAKYPIDPDLGIGLPTDNYPGAVAGRALRRMLDAMGLARSNADRAKAQKDFLEGDAYEFPGAAPFLVEKMHVVATIENAMLHQALIHDGKTQSDYNKMPESDRKKYWSQVEGQLNLIAELWNDSPARDVNNKLDMLATPGYAIIKHYLEKMLFIGRRLEENVLTTFQKIEDHFFPTQEAKKWCCLGEVDFLARQSPRGAERNVTDQQDRSPNHHPLNGISERWTTVGENIGDKNIDVVISRSYAPGKAKEPKYTPARIRLTLLQTRPRDYRLHDFELSAVKRESGEIEITRNIELDFARKRGTLENILFLESNDLQRISGYQTGGIDEKILLDKNGELIKRTMDLIVVEWPKGSLYPNAFCVPILQ